MRSIAKSLIKIANELDTRGHTGLADRLDKIVLAMADSGRDDMVMPQGEAAITEEQPGSAAKRKAESQQMLQVQKLLNRYIKKLEESRGEVYVDPTSPDIKAGDKIFQKVTPENGKVGEQRTWTAINLTFPWKPGVDYKNYAQLIKLLQGEIAKLDASTDDMLQSRLEARQEDEREIMSLWSRIIGLDYDPADAAKYKVNNFVELLDKLENLPPQRGPTDALHRKADELAIIAKGIKADPGKTADLVEWLRAYMSDRLAAVESESED